MTQAQAAVEAQAVREKGIQTKPIEIHGVVSGRRGVVLETFEQILQFARIAFRSNLAPANTQSVEDCFLMIQAGLELGLTPMLALDSMYVVNGHAKIYGDGMWALCRCSPVFNAAMYDEHFVGELGSDDYKAVCTLGRNEPGAKSHTREFSVADAKRAGLMGKDNYKKWLPDMLLRRARSRGCSDVYPDLLKGMGSPETREEVEERMIAEFDLDDTPKAAAMSPKDRMVAAAKTAAATAGQDFPETPTEAAQPVPPVETKPGIPRKPQAATKPEAQSPPPSEPEAAPLTAEEEEELVVSMRADIRKRFDSLTTVKRDAFKEAAGFALIGEINTMDAARLTDVLAFVKAC